jgi:transcriptional regulator with XRE-family HTH domain
MTIGERIAENMELCCMTRKELCEETGLSKQLLSAYITGKCEPRVAHLILLADALGISLDYLIRGEEY